MMSQCEALSDTPLSDGSTVAASILRSITSWICSSGTWSVLTPGETPACSSLGGFTTDSSAIRMDSSRHMSDGGIY